MSLLPDSRPATTLPSDNNVSAATLSAPQGTSSEMPPPGGTVFVISAAAGAIGGIADNSAELQAAANAASAVDGTVWLMPGIYGIGKTVHLPSHVSIEAAAGTVTLRAMQGVQTMIGVGGSVHNGVVDPASDINVSDITIDGNSLSIGNASPLIVSWAANDISFVRDTIENARGIGALVSNTSSCYFVGDSLQNIGNYASITDNLSDCWQGIAFCDSSTFESQGNRVISCKFGQIGLDAVSATEQSNFVVAQSLLSDLNTLAGWQTRPQGAAGIYLDNNSGVLVTGDTISGASGNGVDVANCATVSIDSSSITGNYESGICAAGVSNLSITNSVSDNNNMLNGHYPHTAGLTLTGGNSGQDTGITLTGDQFSNTSGNNSQDYGIQVDPNTEIVGIAIANVSASGNAVAPSNGILPTGVNDGTFLAPVQQFVAQDNTTVNENAPLSIPVTSGPKQDWITATAGTSGLTGTTVNVAASTGSTDVGPSVASVTSKVVNSGMPSFLQQKIDAGLSSRSTLQGDRQTIPTVGWEQSNAVTLSLMPRAAPFVDPPPSARGGGLASPIPYTDLVTYSHGGIGGTANAGAGSF